MKCLVDQIDECLPQVQCAQCGYPRCRQYAQAIAAGAAGIDQCPPGGDLTLAALAGLTGTPHIPLNPAFGHPRPRRVAIIDETRCIGCALCIKACPVDAIVGAAKHMHTVLASGCTGCDLCIAPCPVDCIDMRPVTIDCQTPDWRWPVYPPELVARARRRTAARDARTKAHARVLRKPPSTGSERLRIQNEIREAVKRVRRKRAAVRRGINPAP